MRIQRTLAVLLLAIASCHEDDQNPEDVQFGETGEMPELPPRLPSCPDVDFLTDDQNCGACGHECDVMWPGSDYEAGGCVEGVCGPMWSGIYPFFDEPDPVSCEQICAFDERACIPGGCSGKTGLMCVLEGSAGDDCDFGDPFNEPLLELVGDCAEIPPYPQDLEDGFQPFLNCCCES